MLLVHPVAAVPLASDLLKEAELQETSARDLEAAARLYTEFLEQPGTDRGLQAKAYLHRGLCEFKTGKTDDAKASWKKIVQDYSDQSDSYAEALKQLQQLQLEEQSKVRPSTPVVRVVYETPPARWMVEFPRGTFLRAIDGKGRLVDTAAGGSLGFVNFPTPNLGVGMEFGNLGASGPPSARRNIAYFMILARAEKPVLNGLTFYAKGGPGLYFFKFTNDLKTSSKTNLGGSLEAGFVIGMPRGFAFNFAYLLHAFLQSTPSEDFIGSIPASDRSDAAAVTQNRGFRLVGGPAISLSFRW